MVPRKLKRLSKNTPVPDRRYSPPPKPFKIKINRIKNDTDTKPLRPKERDIMRVILEWLKIRQIEHWRVPVGPVIHQFRGQMHWKGSPLKGFPDICGVLQRTHKGVMFAIEVKAAKGRLRQEQGEWLTRLQRAGCAVIVARSVADVETLMRNWGEI